MDKDDGEFERLLDDWFKEQTKGSNSLIFKDREMGPGTLMSDNQWRTSQLKFFILRSSHNELGDHYEEELRVIKTSQQREPAEVECVTISTEDRKEHRKAWDMSLVLQTKKEESDDEDDKGTLFKVEETADADVVKREEE